MQHQAEALPRIDRLIDAVIDHPVITGWVIVALIVLTILLAFKGPLSRAIDSIARRGGRLPGGIELNPETASAQKQSEALHDDSRTFDSVTQALLGPVIDERAQTIDATVRNLPAGEQHRALLVIAARDQIVSEYYRIYQVIYGSQIAAIKAANVAGPSTREALQATYEDAAKRDPEFFDRGITFDQWLAFLVSGVLLREDAGRYRITNSGHLFLHFMVREGLSDYGLPHNARR